MTILFTTVALLTQLLGSPTNAINRTPEVPHEANLQVTVPDQLDIYIELLAFEESSGRENIQIIDTNGKRSSGCLQYQDATFEHFSKKFNLPGDILDCRLQKAITREVLLRGGRQHWYTSVTRLANRGAEVPVLDL